MTKSNEDAVSPVIGVILMVAVTVILAAVIAAFVFGMGSNISKTKIVAATAQIVEKGATDAIVVTYQGGQDDDKLDRGTGKVPLVASVNGAPIVTDNNFKTPFAVGCEATANKGTTKDHVTVTALFSDGTSQVILDTQV